MEKVTFEKPVKPTVLGDCFALWLYRKREYSKTMRKNSNIQRNPNQKKNQNKKTNKKKYVLVKPNMKKIIVNEFRRRNRPVITNVPAAKGFDYKQGRGPKVTHSGNTVTVEHREYIAAINGTPQAVEGMYLEKVRVNPGDSETFEWLSLMAVAYEKYEIQSMVFEYVPSTPSITPGQIIMVPDYNVDNEQQLSVGQVLNNMDAVNGAAWTAKKLTIDAKKFNQTKSYLVRNDTIVTDNYLLYDPVNVYVGTQGTPDQETFGQLFISYRIKLMIPSTTGIRPILGGGFNGTSVTDNTGRIDFTQLALGAGNSKFGNYLPNLIGNYFQFTVPFSGIMTLYISTANGFDIGRSLVLTGGEGAQTWPHTPVVNDTIVAGSPDQWLATCQVNSPVGGTVYLQNALFSPPNPGIAVSLRFECASINPRFWQFPSPYVAAWSIVGPSGGINRTIGNKIDSKNKKQLVKTSGRDELKDFASDLILKLLEEKNTSYSGGCSFQSETDEENN